MIVILTIAALIAGPVVMLGIWLWLRARRPPVPLGAPLDIGQVLGQTFTVFRPENVLVAALAVLLIGLLSLLWQIVYQQGIQAATQMRPSGVAPTPFAILADALSLRTVLVMLAYYIALTIFYVAAIRVLAHRFEGRPISIGDALRPVPMLAASAVVAKLLNYLGMALGLLLFIVPGVVLALGWSVVLPVIAVERAGLLASFGRSRALTIGSRGRIFVLILLMSVLAIALTAVTNGASAILRPGALAQPSAIGIALHAIVSVMIGMVFAGFSAALYVELRRSRKGLATPDLAATFA